MQDDILDFESKKKKKPKFIFSEADTNNCVEDSDTLDFGAKKKKKGVKIDLTDDSKLKKDEEFDGKKKKKVTDQSRDVDKLADKLNEKLDFSDKKKKKNSKLFNPDLVGSTDSGAAGAQPITKDSSGYDYETLLTRVFTQLGDLNPELMSDQKRKLTMVPPQMARVGTKKTSFVNFSTICRSLNRDSNHLTTYILTELGTQGSIDAKGALLIRGRYASKQIEALLRNYCRNYVLCGTCQSSDTELCKDSRLLFLHCRRCGSRFTVKTVTSGFQAVTGKRAALRAKAQ